MEFIEEMKGANIITTKCANIEDGADVLIVSDWPSSKIAERVGAALKTKSCSINLVFSDPVPHSNAEPSQIVADSMKQADVIFAIVNDTISHSAAVTNANTENTQYISVPKYTTEQLKTGALFADFEAISPKVEQLTQMLTDASVARVSSPQGTDITVDISNQAGRTVNSIPRPKTDHVAAGALEATISPVSGSAQGSVVVDGAIPDLNIGRLKNNVELTIESGHIVEITGGEEAKRIKRVWEEYDDPSVFNIAQLAVGMNPNVREFDDKFITAHCKYGNVHFGFGTSKSLLGGDVRAPAHFDAMMSEATLELDNNIVLKNGEEFTF